MKRPFFILGCVRSGTTFLRNVLRRHPNLAAPEETHFYRWADPFGTPTYSKALIGNKTLIRHRELDGITESTFRRLLEKSRSKADLYRRYMRHYIAKAKPEANRWFDKTPQNVFGAALLASEFPGSKLIHIVRDPMDVVSSLKVGKIMHIPQVVGACNYWIEAIEIMSVLKKAYPKRVYEVRYEDLTGDLDGHLRTLLAYLGEDYDAEAYSDVVAAPKHHEYEGLFSEEEIAEIRTLCGKHGAAYGYLQKQDRV